MLEHSGTKGPETFASKSNEFETALRSIYRGNTSHVLINPSREQIAGLARDIRHQDIHLGMRRAKFYNFKTGEIASLLWPAADWLHSHIGKAAESVYQDFKPVEGGSFRFDNPEKKGYSQERLDEIVRWIKAPPSKPGDPNVLESYDERQGSTGIDGLAQEN